jgi:1,4-dihydroxy-2-naphthoyl-CoA hydrolase
MQISVDFLNEFFLKDQMAGHLEMRFTAIEGQSVSGELTVSKIHARPGGIMNGSTSLFLIETLASVAGSCAIDLTKFNVFGLEMNCNHLKQVLIGETVTGTASPIHLGRSTQVWEVKIKSSEKLVCIGRATLFVADKNPTMSK